MTVGISFADRAPDPTEILARSRHGARVDFAVQAEINSATSGLADMCCLLESQLTVIDAIGIAQGRRRGVLENREYLQSGLGNDTRLPGSHALPVRRRIV